MLAHQVAVRGEYHVCTVKPKMSAPCSFKLVDELPKLLPPDPTTPDDDNDDNDDRDDHGDHDDDENHDDNGSSSQ